MKYIAIFTVFTALVCALDASIPIPLRDYVNHGRIISGRPAAVGQFPWQVAVRATNDNISYSFCGGSIISNQWILTAAHCVSGFRSYIVILGGIRYTGAEAGRISVNSNESIVHSNFNPGNLNNDIALVKLPSPVQYTNNIKRIRLPNRGQRVGVGRTLTVSGWGKTSDALPGISTVLNFVELTSISNAECALSFSGIIASTLCCRGNPEHSTCQGDSGGPLVSYDSNRVATQVGIVSFVHSGGCSLGHPSGFVRTESFLDWIRINSGVTP